MTKIKPGQELKRETGGHIFDRGKSRAIVVTLMSHTLVLRARGCRVGYTLAYDDLYTRGAKAEAGQA